MTNDYNPAKLDKGQRNNNQTEMIFQIKGMDCAGCAQTVERGVSQLPGVAVCSLNFSTERIMRN